MTVKRRKKGPYSTYFNSRNSGMTFEQYRELRRDVDATVQRKDQTMPSDKLKGQTNKGHAPYGYSTSGPKGWRGPDNHVADSRRGRTAADKGATITNTQSMEKHQGGRSKVPIRWGVPHSSHPIEGAVRVPKKASKRRDPLGRT
jgi:hypothetical protein